MKREKEKKKLKKQVYDTIGFTQILENLKDYANTTEAKDLIEQLAPYLSERELKKHLRDTTQARQLLEKVGNPPIPIMKNITEYVDRAVRGDFLTAVEIEEVGMFLSSINRLRMYLESGKHHEIGLAWYSDNLVQHQELREEIQRSIRGGIVDDYASKELREIRKDLQSLEEKMRQKAEHVLQTHKAYLADSFVVTRHGRFCIPVKAQYKKKVDGAEIDTSATNSTVFIEPKSVAKICDQIEILKFAQEEEERCILYGLADQIANHELELKENIRLITMLDFVFAKGKMASDMAAIEPEINTERRILIEKGRHPLLDKESCVPLDFTIGDKLQGVIITGPNTGGKTVAIKTVALLSVMACSGLHVPAKTANITMNSQVLCDIGDGQDMKDNLSTFSAHIKNIISVLESINEESLVILDELGSGTDPAEGMGIAIAILEALRKSKALFLVTTHYPEVKEYADRHSEIANARMAFDRESLKPLYRLEMGRAGESCALYIAKRLGLPNSLLLQAANEAYGSKSKELIRELELEDSDAPMKKVAKPHIKKADVTRQEAIHGTSFSRGDSVTILPDGKIGIVVTPADQHGEVLVQLQKEKFKINHKRLKLKVAATELYPEDYDFSIVFDSVENRKARHQMSKHHIEGLEIS